MSDEDSEARGYTALWGELLAVQTRALPRCMQLPDRAILALSRWTLVAMGACFTLMVSLEVVSRFLFGFSTYFVSAAAKFTLLWFFLLGGGLALRLGAHVGFVLLVNALPGAIRTGVTLAMQFLALAFFLEMIWSGLAALGPAMTQTDPALKISLFWAFLSVPAGFGLLAYHMIVLMLLELRAPAESRMAP